MKSIEVHRDWYSDAPTQGRKHVPSFIVESGSTLSLWSKSRGHASGSALVELRGLSHKGRAFTAFIATRVDRILRRATNDSTIGGPRSLGGRLCAFSGAGCSGRGEKSRGRSSLSIHPFESWRLVTRVLSIPSHGENSADRKPGPPGSS